MTKQERGADIVYSPDDDGWYATMFTMADCQPIKRGADSPIVPSKAAAEAWAQKRGAVRFLYP